MATALENALEQLLPTLRKIPKKELKKLDMPAHAAAHDALFTYKWCLADEALLTARKLSWELVESIPLRVMAFEEAQSNWHNVRFGREEAMKIWKRESPGGYELRDDLLSEFYYAYRKSPGIQTRVSAVAEGTGDADMIQDLNDLVVIGRENPEPLSATGFDFTLLDTAAAMCKRLGDLRADASVDKGASREKKLIRDQAYTHLMEAVDEVRECGEFVFRKDEDRRNGYLSQYHKQKRSRSTKKTDAAVTEALSQPVEEATPQDTASKSA